MAWTAHPPLTGPRSPSAACLAQMLMEYITAATDRQLLCWIVRQNEYAGRRPAYSHPDASTCRSFRCHSSPRCTRPHVTSPRAGDGYAHAPARPRPRYRTVHDPDAARIDGLGVLCRYDREGTDQYNQEREQQNQRLQVPETSHCVSPPFSFNHRGPPASRQYSSRHIRPGFPAICRV